jgi:hypothetical protein
MQKYFYDLMRVRILGKRKEIVLNAEESALDDLTNRRTEQDNETELAHEDDNEHEDDSEHEESSGQL